MTTRGFCACCGMPECIIDGTDGRECFHCGDGAPMPVDEVAAAIAAERARCAAVCREVAAEYEGHPSAVARQCAEAVERGPSAPGVG